MAEYEKGIPETEMTARISGLQDRMQGADVDGILILQKVDMFYCSGTAQQGWLFIPVTGKPLLMVFKEYSRARAETDIEQVVSLVSPKKIPQILGEYGYESPKKLGLELDVLTANQYFLFQDIFRGCDLIDFSMQIRLQRAVKSPYEIDKMRAASQMADKVAGKVVEILSEGMTEIEFAGELEAYARRLGHQGLIRMRMWDNDLFYGHIMAGAGAAVPGSFASPTGGRGINPSIAQGPSFETIGRNVPILVDYVFVLDGYVSDHTRIFAIGDLPDALKNAHDVMLEIQEDVKKNALPGVPTGRIYDTMMAKAEQAGLQEFFMGASERKIRFTGHGVGLELDEFPFVAQGQNQAFQEGMILALEPKVVIPGQGVVGIENTLLVTADGLESLTLFNDQITFL